MSSTINVRLLGLVVGIGVGLGFAGAVALVDAIGSGIAISPGVVPPILISGAVGGWLMAPEGTAAHTRFGWVRVVLALALLALVVGDAVVVVGLAWDSGGHAGWPFAFVPLLGSMGALMAVGLVAAGWLVLPCTIVASAMWATSMRVLAARLGVGDQPA